MMMLNSRLECIEVSLFGRLLIESLKFVFEHLCCMLIVYELHGLRTSWFTNFMVYELHGFLDASPEYWHQRFGLKSDHHKVCVTAVAFGKLFQACHQLWNVVLVDNLSFRHEVCVSGQAQRSASRRRQMGLPSLRSP